MTKSSQATEPTNPQAGTGEGEPQATPPAATQQPNADGAATNDDNDLVQIKRSDLKKLQSQRDGSNEELRQNSMLVNSLVQKEAIREALNSSEFKEKYPDVVFEDLTDAMSDEEIIEIAEARQQRYESVKQAHMKKVQVASAPTISAADKDTQLKELAKPDTKSRFGAALRLQRMQVK